MYINLAKISFSNSLLQGAVFSNVLWGKAGVGRSHDMLELYMQLKQIYSSQGDRVLELHFKGLELHTFYKMIRWRWNNLGTKLVLFVDRYASGFGLSIENPIIGLFLIHLLLFLLLLASGRHEYVGLNFAEPSWHYFDVAFGEYWRLLLPTHLVKLNGWVLLVDLLMRLSSSLFIYNIIRVSRRFARS
jgi:Cdc6-like AAA superfamily ATPase